MRTIVINNPGPQGPVGPQGAPLSYKVYTALLIQSGGYGLQNQQSGLLTVGVTYYINASANTSDFINVGAPNNNAGTYFVATGTTPASWGEATLIYNTGAPVATVLENTTGLNLYFTYQSAGLYQLQISDVSISDKSVMISVNGGIYSGIPYIGSPGVLIKANYSYEENLVYITSFENGVPANNLLSDSDRFYRTSLEIRVYN